jgi:hypothetical protein
LLCSGYHLIVWKRERLRRPGQLYCAQHECQTEKLSHGQSSQRLVGKVLSYSYGALSKDALATF